MTAGREGSPVRVSRGPVVIPTYRPAPPDRNPMFLEKRVYQGSSGRVYPLPFTDRIAEEAVPQAWDAVVLENAHVQVTVLPQLGGRIHAARDRSNGYDFFYRQEVIKPALVGLAGPWISGGIEFNWPQHHRPSTFMPADVHVEEHDDGAVTVWLSEHDPMARMKGMHGVRLRPGSSVIEVEVRVHNRTPHPQTFHWWANVATRVHERYQSFFPPDVTYVADHAKRATSRFPRCAGRYYGVDYGSRARHGVSAGERPRQFVPPRDATGTPEYDPADLSWYANIPVPTSYMAMGSQEDFFGGYDHAAEAGVVHVADHHVAPGKKQWTWGNHEFGYAWDRNLTDPDANGVCHPYIEIMAGVFTDNQPDFSFLQPGETKSWRQCWYPIRAIGPAQHANVDAALALRVAGRRVRVGICPSRVFPSATVTLRHGERAVWTRVADLAPATPLVASFDLRRAIEPTELRLVARDAEGREIVAWGPRPVPQASADAIARAAASEPPPPEVIAGTDELFVTGLHLAQYRHATRCPTLYWREALRRDPGDSRCHTALGKWHLQRGELGEAEAHFRAAVTRLTLRNPNPADGEAHYQLGQTLRTRALARRTKDARAAEALERDAYAALAKSTWNQAWAAAGLHALAEIDAARGAWATALDHLDRALRLDTDHLRARDLRVVALRRLGRCEEATAALRATLSLDPLDWWARHLAGEALACDNQVRLDLAHDCVRAGLFDDALEILDGARAQSENPADLGSHPLVAYTAAWICLLKGDAGAARRRRRIAREAAPDYCFPARLEELLVLRSALDADPRDARAAFYLGHLLYDRRRHREAIGLWQSAVRHEPRNAVAWRCLGIGAWNVLRQPQKARRAYDRAFRANPRDARLLFERDQLWKRLGVPPARRLRELEGRVDLVGQRDDLSVELCALYNQCGRPERALAILEARRFQPWEGGEGQALGQHVRTHVALGRKALAAGDAEAGVRHFEAALGAPPNLGEAWHPLANASDVRFWLGEALAAAGRTKAARAQWAAAAGAEGDFQEMSVRRFSEKTCFSALALLRLGRKVRARRLLRDLLSHAHALARTPATIDYFATSLPTMLLFDDDLERRQQTAALFLEAQARLGLGQRAAGRRLLRAVLRRDPDHPLAADLLSERHARKNP